MDQFEPHEEDLGSRAGWLYLAGHMATTRMEAETRQFVALLGGPGIFDRKIRNTRELKAALRSGFPYAAFESV